MEDEPAVGAYELNISCPNVDQGGMTFGVDPQQAASVMRVCRELTSRPIIVKLTPNVTDITVIAQSVVDAGADAVSLINTVLGMAIDARTRKAVMGRKVGGLSGPAIKPIALRMVYEVASCVQVPIIGMGGISNATDAIEFILAGATAVAVGTANFMNPCSAVNVVDGISQYCIDNGVSSISELVGALQ